MRACLAILLLIPRLSLAHIYAAAPAKEKATLLGAWEAIDLSDSGYIVYRMVLLPGDDGYLVCPLLSHAKQLRHATHFFGRLASLEFKDSHVKLVFKRLPSQVDEFGPVGYDAIEIEGKVVALEGVEEQKGVAAINGTITIHESTGSKTHVLHMEKPVFVNRLDADARRAEELISEEMKPGPKGSREDALSILRESGDIDDNTRVLSVEWRESTRQWIVDLEWPGHKLAKIAVNVQAHDWYYVNAESGKK